MKLRALLLLILATLSCQKVTPPILTSSIVINIPGHFDGATRAEALLSSSDIAPLADSLAILDSFITGIIQSVPAGASRKLTINVYQGSILRYYGSCLFDVENEQPISLSLNLRPVEIAGTECRPSNIVCDTSGGLYLLSWKPYEDTAEYRKGRYSYMLVMDTSQTVEIANDFDRYRKQVVFVENDPFAVSCEYPIGNEQVARFRLFILSESYRQIINDCGGIVYVVKPGM